MPTATIKFTSDFVVETIHRFRKQHRARFVGLAIKIIAVALLAPIALWTFQRGHFWVSLFLGSLCVLAFVAHHIDYWRARRAFRKSPYYNDEFVIQLTEEGFSSRSSKQEATLQWSSFSKFVEFQDGFLLFQGPHIYYWIPTSSLDSPSQAMDLQAILGSKIRNKRIVEPIDRAEPPPSAAIKVTPLED